MNRPLKILLTADPMIPVPPEHYGGIERIIDILIKGLLQRGHQVTLCAHKDSMVECQLVAYRTAGSNAKDHLSNLWHINRTALRGNFDIVHSFGRLLYLLPLLPLKIPKLMSYQREPTLSQVRRAMRYAAKDSLAFTGCSDYITNKIKPFAPAHTVFNGVDLGIYQYKATVSTDAPLVFLGRIEPIKGPDTAIQIAQTSGRDLIIAGNIPPGEQAYFDTEIAPFLSDRIRYIGPVNDAQKNELLGAAYALLMPIHWDEPFGIVMAEALACGTPVLALKRGAVPEVIRPGLNGYYAETATELAGIVDAVGQLDRSLIRADTAARFSDSIIVEEYIRIYEQMIQRV